MLGLGFRPFFLIAALAAVLLLGAWVLDYTGWLSMAAYYPSPIWHAHEMLFGYTGAVVAGFLLTAVRNWTGLDTVRGTALGGLVAVWLAGRLAPLGSAALAPPVIAAIDLLFLPLLAAALAPVLVRGGQTRNLVFVAVLAALTAANALVHAEMLGYTVATARIGLYLGVDLAVLLIAVIGGRVFPFFIERALAGARPRRWRAVEVIAIAAIASLLAAEPYTEGGWLAAALALLAASAHAVRLWGWYDRRIWSVPLLWVLFLGYGWIVIGFLLHAAAAAALLPARVAVHGFTAGAIGTVTLGMMARVALGHTGRPLRPAPIMSLAFALVTAAAVVRVAGAAAAPDEWYTLLIGVAGGLWMAAFAMFFAVYAPILLRPRPDGAPG